MLLVAENVVARRCSRVDPLGCRSGPCHKPRPTLHADRHINLDQPLEKLEQLEHAIEETIDEAIPPKSRWRVAARIAAWALVVLYFLFAAALLSLRYWILPKVAEYRSDIEQYASKALGQRITIGAIEADWQGLRPELLLANRAVLARGRGDARLDLRPGRIAAVLFARLRPPQARDQARRGGQVLRRGYPVAR